jgi:DNA-binding response OmpR family regulator
MPKILIVDVQENLLLHLSFLFKNYGFEVQTASLGYESFVKVNKFKPELVLVDVGLAEEDGRTVCKQLKSVYPVKIILYSSKNHLPQGLNNGMADDYITNPLDSGQLIDKINCLLFPTNTSAFSG